MRPSLSDRVKAVAERLGVDQGELWEALSDEGFVVDTIVADEARQEAARRREDSKLRKRDFVQRNRPPKPPGDGGSPGNERSRRDGEQRLASNTPHRGGQAQHGPERESSPGGRSETHVRVTRVPSHRLALAVLDDALSKNEERQRHGGDRDAPRRPR